jgi:hypothetical protein
MGGCVVAAGCAGAALAGGVPALSLVRDDGHGLPGMYGGSWGAADFDADGDVDLVVIGHFRTMFHSSDNPGGGSEELRLYRNVSVAGGAIRFELQATLPNANANGNRGASLAVGDLDDDGRPDFAVQMRNGGNVAAFHNRGAWTFDRFDLGFANNSNSLGMVATDVDRDGRDDLVFPSDGGVGAGLWYRWSGSAWQSRQSDFPHAISYGGTIAAGDLDGDDYPEIAVGGNSNQPFGSHDCSQALQYGHTHRNLGDGSGFALPAMSVVGAWGYKVPPAQRSDIDSCHGMDNAQMAIADLDGDGANDVVIAGSSTGQDGPVGLNGQQYDFAVLFNDGSGVAFEIWENTGPQDPNGGTNGGVGNLDFPSIAIGDFSGDGELDVFVQGHRRDFDIDTDPYIFEDLIFVNNGDRSFSRVALDAFLPRFGASENLPGGGAGGSLSLNYLRGRPRYVAEGGTVAADFNGDGDTDLLFSGAELPYHTNGSNFRDFNDVATLRTYVLAADPPLFADGFED